MALCYIKGRPYYYKSLWRNGRAVRKYVAAGQVAILHAELDRTEREDEKAARERWRSERERINAEDAWLDAVWALTETAVAAALEAAGYHRPHRHAWRRRRRTMRKSKTPRREKASPDPKPLTPRQADRLVERANDDDAEAMKELRQRGWPGTEHAREYAERASPVRLAVERLLDSFAGDMLAVKTAMRLKLAAVQAGLAGESPTPSETMLAERAAFCWLQLYVYEFQYAGRTGLSFVAADFYQRRIDRAQRRFFAALKTLAIVRRLDVPDLHANVFLAAGAALAAPPETPRAIEASATEE